MNLNVNASATTDYLGSAALEKLTGIPASTWRYWVLTGEGPESCKLGRRSVSSALRAVALNLLDEHLDHCVSSAIAQGVTKRMRSLPKPPPRSRDSFGLEMSRLTYIPYRGMVQA